jgi:16S rRNA G527 N7-methylase RsmG
LNGLNSQVSYIRLSYVRKFDRVIIPAAQHYELLSPQNEPELYQRHV